ncbi:hypothetical protein JKP88DRAFT_325988 [Tribonema minus]|uniref:Uncharacterized protein n=1 Tax=Tribonema minus TaxID=303371 RepID=A0A835Z0C3_9STRA|nr:hypothetical protein JKP88DRAFT_325988 [Tribonema minus]
MALACVSAREAHWAGAGCCLTLAACCIQAWQQQQQGSRGKRDKLLATVGGHGAGGTAAQQRRRAQRKGAGGVGTPVGAAAGYTYHVISEHVCPLLPSSKWRPPLSVCAPILFLTLTPVPSSNPLMRSKQPEHCDSRPRPHAGQDDLTMASEHGAVEGAGGDGADGGFSVWREAMQFVGPGHYLMLASVSKGWKRQQQVLLSNDTSFRTVCRTHTLCRWARQQGCPGARICECLAAQGQLELLQLLRTGEQAFEWDAATPAAAAAHGQVDTLVWACNQGCPIDTSACWLAALSGHVPVLQWLRERKPRFMWQGWYRTRIRKALALAPILPAEAFAVPNYRVQLDAMEAVVEGARTVAVAWRPVLRLAQQHATHPAMQRLALSALSTLLRANPAADLAADMARHGVCDAMAMALTAHAQDQGVTAAAVDCASFILRRTKPAGAASHAAVLRHFRAAPAAAAGVGIVRALAATLADSAAAHSGGWFVVCALIGAGKGRHVDQQDALGGAGACEAAVEALQRHSNFLPAQRWAARAVAALADRHATNRVRLVNAWACEEVLAAWRRAPWAQVHVRAAAGAAVASLCGLQGGALSAAQLGAAGACELVAEELRRANKQGQASLQCDCVIAIIGLCCGAAEQRSNQDRLGAAGACAGVVAALKSPAGPMIARAGGLVAMDRLAAGCHAANQGRLGKAGACWVACHALQEHADRPVVVGMSAMAAEALAQQCAANKRLLRAGGACRALVAALRRAQPGGSAAHACAGAVAALARGCADGRRAAVAAGACEAVVEACGDAGGCRLRGLISSVAAIAHLAHDCPEGRTRLGTAGACAVLTVALQACAEGKSDPDGKAPDVCWHAAVALLELTDGHPENCSRCGAAGACEALVAAMAAHRSDEGVAEAAARAVGCLAAGDPDNRRRLRAAGAEAAVAAAGEAHKGHGGVWDECARAAAALAPAVDAA